MSLNYRDAYPGRIATDDPLYPYGKPRNVSAQNAGDGTPWEASLAQDIIGFLQAILIAGSIAPSGQPDNATTSQYLQALRAIMAEIVTSNAISESAVRTLITNAINGLVAGAPGALDTLNELAAALGDDAAFSTRVTNQLAAKAPIASPVFTGNPRGPTPAEGDNDTSLATTAFVERVRAALALADTALRNELRPRVLGGNYPQSAQVTNSVTEDVATINIDRTGYWFFIGEVGFRVQL